ncbi:hypothetical protein M378DRAFT_84358 [Amanita muscaria Koide BX008]|uniref:Ribonucleases P/MRP subunit Pop8-like domain-containing protein n=1 Tax=Amanita muscaria (strain Koide BX008) TaxID=946122 RepID=A0A0C2T0M8_AMAMK|nr:hypothetical protein M378DRAFT_84358 [Amanita muscaria Koide BX008]
MQRPLRSPYRYIRLSVVPPTLDILYLRKSFQDALSALFGVTSASIYLDILWLADDGSQFVLRVGEQDSPRILAATASMSESPRISLVKQSGFLPALLAQDPTGLSLIFSQLTRNAKGSSCWCRR